MKRLLATLALLIAATACDPPPQQLLPTTALDLAAYRESVHRVVEVRCATLDCHGNTLRPLRIYSETGLRLRDELRDTALTDQELLLTIDSFASIDPDHLGTPSHLALRKPLALSAGGIHHEGLVHFPSTDDPAYQCLSRWLSSDLDPSFDAICDAAYVEKPFNPE